MQQIQTIGIDLAKNVFQVRGVDDRQAPRLDSCAQLVSKRCSLADVKMVGGSTFAFVFSILPVETTVRTVRGS